MNENYRYFFQKDYKNKVLRVLSVLVFFWGGEGGSLLILLSYIIAYFFKEKRKSTWTNYISNTHYSFYKQNKENHNYKDK